MGSELGIDGKTVLTGIKPTGDIHIGHERGVITPTLEIFNADSNLGQKLILLADVHALNSGISPEQMHKNSMGIAATWLALGLDHESTALYRQSRIHPIGTLSMMLAAVTPKGMMDRAHAYKAAVEKGESVNMGLYTYPIMMTSDIAGVQADLVPIGEDQKQHIEIAQNTIGRFNRMYGTNLRIPDYMIVEGLGKIPGVDGRKMSKSYENAIPVFGSDSEWKKAINKIETSSTPRGASVPDFGETIFGKIFKAVARPAEYKQLENEMLNGTSTWSHAKEMLLNELEVKYGGKRDEYNNWVASPKRLEEVLKKGEAKAEGLAADTLKQILKSTGMNDFYD